MYNLKYNIKERRGFITIGFKIRIYPDEEQIKILNLYCDTSHHAWNNLVQKFNNNLPIIGRFGIKDYKIKDFQNEFGYKNIPSRTIESVFQYYCTGLQLFYDGVNIHPPKFHKYNKNKRSFCSYHVDWEIKKNSIPLPHTHINNISAKLRIPIDIKRVNELEIRIIKNAKFYNIGNKWYISGSCESSLYKPKHNTQREIIGLDWGIKNFITTSDRRIINYPQTVDREFFRIKRLKKKLENKINNSNNYNKLNLKINKAYIRYMNLKDDFIKRTSFELLKDNDISIEKIENYRIYSHKKMNNKVMTANRNMHPLYNFTVFLKWSAFKNGYNVYEVPSYNTSKTCNNCGKIKKNLSLDDRLYICECGYIEDRDINAAKNIKYMAEINR